MKQIVTPVISLALVAFLATTALSAEGGNPRKGKALFKKSCKECHVKGGAGGEVTPLTKTMEQWDRYFEKLQHNPEGLKGLSEQDLKDIQQFLFDHAADSPQPETCG
ncbi:MAG: c-type cytochrome [Desulfuromonadales bacterium]|nr:c-type cytochrome [Desulfuromonadales bacterium]